MNLRKYSHLKLGLVLGGGALLASVLCVQCVRTYLYTDSVLVPQQAEREAERQAGALTTAARSAGVLDPHQLGPILEHALDAAADRVLWMRLLDQDSNVLAQAGAPQGSAKIPSGWWQRFERHDSLGQVVVTAHGSVLVAMLPFRMPRPPHPPEMNGPPPSGRRGGPGGLVLELAIPLKAVSGAFEGLRENLIVGLVASIALLAALGLIALRARRYMRGQYLESELQLARRVQSDLQPRPDSVSPYVEFAAAAVAADHVGGDFHDIFETASGEIGIVLGDVSGKGVPAALLVSVLQGAIRSATTTQHEVACERINGMLCERTACARFATLFWGAYDPSTRLLSYVNAGHAAPMLFRQGRNRMERLDEGGPVLGLLPLARYSAGTVEIHPADTLVLYSDGINEAANRNDEEFGEDRIQQAMSDAAPAEICDRLMRRVAAFSKAGTAPDDRTLMIVRFPQAETSVREGITISLEIAAA